MVKRVKRAAAIVGIGLALQLAASLHWTPATFILSAAIGLPLVLLGSVLFLAAVWRNLKDRGAA
jgi:hypothetical protein